MTGPGVTEISPGFVNSVLLLFWNGVCYGVFGNPFACEHLWFIGTERGKDVLIKASTLIPAPGIGCTET